MGWPISTDDATTLLTNAYKLSLKEARALLKRHMGSLSREMDGDPSVGSPEAADGDHSPQSSSSGDNEILGVVYPGRYLGSVFS